MSSSGRGMKGRHWLFCSDKTKTCCSTVVTPEPRKRQGEVKTTTTVLERTITKLCRLEMDGN